MFFDDEKEGEAPEEAQEESGEATESEEGESGEGEEGEEGEGKPKSKKKLIMIVALVVVLAGAGGGTFFMLNKKKKDAEEAERIAAEASKKKEPIFHDLKDIIVNLNTGGKSVSFLKLKITLEIDGKENLDTVQKQMPRIDDIFQMYLRELRPSDLQGSVGLYRLREELLLRINKVIYPAQVNDILFKDVLVQ